MLLLLLFGINTMPRVAVCGNTKSESTSSITYDALHSDFAEQITCERVSNPVAESLSQVTISTTSCSTLSRTATPRHQSVGSTLHSIACGLAYCTEYHHYRLSNRAIDYYLYTLCVLRL